MCKTDKSSQKVVGKTNNLSYIVVYPNNDRGIYKKYYICKFPHIHVLLIKWKRQTKGDDLHQLVMTKTIVSNPIPSFYVPTEVLPEPTNWNYELDQLLDNFGFQRELIGNSDYLIYTHPKTKMRVESNNLNMKDCYTIFPFGDSEYYNKSRKGSLVEVDTLSEVKHILAKHKIIK